MAQASSTKPQVGMFRRMLNNILMIPRDALSRIGDPRRDIEAECGHNPLTSAANVEEYYQLFKRDPIARRVVRVLPKESWQVQPSVYEDANPKALTQFESVWYNLGRQLEGNSFYQDERGSTVWEYLRRADELSGIGRYGVIFLGVDGMREGESLATPLPFWEEGKSLPKPRKLLFLTILPESLATINTLETSLSSPRYGQPTSYNLTLSDPREFSSGVMTAPNTEKTVHWTRIIHIADNVTTSRVFGDPRMHAVEDRLKDGRKLYGGSAEMYYKGAFPGLSAESHPSLGGDVEVDEEAVKDMLEDYMNGLQRYLFAAGLTMKSLAPQVVDPTPQIMAQLQAICIELGVPLRVFLGSERGELASSQDDAAWNDRLRERQNFHITPRIIVPFVDRLIRIGVLPVPKGFSVSWPDLTSQTTQEKSQVAFQKTQALVQYANSTAPVVFPPLDYFTRILGIPEDEALAVLENAKSAGLDLNEYIAEKLKALAPKAEAAPGQTAPGPNPDRRTARSEVR